MTTVVILMMGFGAILIISAIETDPNTGNSVSVLQTISDVWNNRVSFTQPSMTTGGPPASGGGGSSGGFGSRLPPQPVTPLGTAAQYDAFRRDTVRHYIGRVYGR